MVFSSHIFLFYFLPLALLVYYLSPRVLKTLSLALVSYVFYGWWNPWFVLLMLGSTAVDFFCGQAICGEGASHRRKKIAVTVSVAVNLGVLAFFKYAAFFANTLDTVGWGIPMPDFLYQIVLPVGSKTKKFI